jgi:hypothetical protein
MQRLGADEIDRQARDYATGPADRAEEKAKREGKSPEECHAARLKAFRMAYQQEERRLINSQAVEYV